MRSSTPIAAIRRGQPEDVPAVLAGVVRGSGTIFGQPKSDLSRAANQVGKRVLWFFVAVDAAGSPVGVVFYESGTSLRILNLRLTSMAVCPSLEEEDRAAVAASLVLAIEQQFGGHTKGRGYLAADVELPATVAADVLHAAGWRRLHPGSGTQTDRFVKFMETAAAAA